MDIFERAAQLAYWSPIVFFSIGVPSALLNLITFISIKTFRHCPTIYYVVGQSFSDIITLSIVFVQIFPSTAINGSSIGCKLGLYISQLIIPCSMSFVYLSSFDRWSCTSQSARFRQLSSTRIARRLFLLPFILWPSVNIPFLIYSDLVPPFFTCGFTNSYFEQIGIYFLGPIAGVILPLLLLIIFTLLTYRNIRLVTRVRQQPVRNRLSMWEQQMTKMMLAQTLLTMLCTLPRTILVIYSLITLNQRATRSFERIVTEYLIDQITASIMSINFASSFYIYFLSSARLRKTILMHIKRILHLDRNQVTPNNMSVTAPRITIHPTQKQNINSTVGIEEL